MFGAAKRIHLPERGTRAYFGNMRSSFALLAAIATEKFLAALATVETLAVLAAAQPAAQAAVKLLAT